MSEQTLIEPRVLREAALYFRAVNHPLRQKMITLLHKEQHLTVTDIYQKLNLVQAVASQQLAILRRAGLVVPKQAGKMRFYAINYERLKQLHQVSWTLNVKGDLL